MWRLSVRVRIGFVALFLLAISLACSSGSAPSPASGSTYNNLDPNILPPGVNVPSQATIARNAQANPGWQTCVGSCANAPVPQTYTLTQNIASPSLNSDGTSSSYYENGTPYGDVLWYYQFGDSTATNFVVDLYLMIDHPENVEALEFAVLKNDGLNWYKTSTQCNYQSGALRGFDVQSFQWVSLGATCVQATANTWQRVTLQYSITGGQTNFESVSFNGTLQPIAVSLPPEPQTTDSELLGIHIQLDNANTTAGYTVYVDDWSLYSW
ncbi:MAG: hypothetical protein ABR874_07710 [Candidatus Sulfotelmatobacter sp.]|jgi:hypothetical protein